MPGTETWIAKLRSGDVEGAWDGFITLHRNLIFKAIRHYADGYDDVMDVFAYVCETLRKDDLARIRKYLDHDGHTAQLTTWLVSVVRNLTVDSFRQRDGRKRPSKMVESLPELQQEVFELVARRGFSHRESFETLKSRTHPGLTFREFLSALGELHRAVAARGRGVVYRELIGVDLSVELGNLEEEESPGDNEASVRLAAAMARLNPEDRAAVMLFSGHGVNAKEVARILGWPGAKMVYNRVSRSLDKLKQELTRSTPTGDTERGKRGIATVRKSFEECDDSGPSNTE